MSQAGRTRYFARSCLVLRARVALRAKYRVRPAWLIKRLSCRLLVFWHLRLAPSTCISFYLETNNFFSGLEYHPHAYPMKTITENASFQKRSPEWRFLNWRRLLVYLWTDDNVSFQIQSYDTSSWLLAWRMLNKGCYCISIVLAFSCDSGRKRFEYAACGCGQKNLLFQKYPDTCGRGLNEKHNMFEPVGAPFAIYHWPITCKRLGSIEQSSKWLEQMKWTKAKL